MVGTVLGDMSPISRRSLLRALPSGAAVLGAGCLSGGTGQDGGRRTGTPTGSTTAESTAQPPESVPEYDPPSADPYARFVPGGDARRPYTAAYTSPSGMAERTDAFADPVAKTVTKRTKRLGLPPAAVDNLVTTPRWSVATGGFDRERARKALAEVYGDGQSVEDGSFVLFEGDRGTAMLGEKAILLPRVFTRRTDTETKRAFGTSVFDDGRLAGGVVRSDPLPDGIGKLIDLLGAPEYLSLNNAAHVWEAYGQPPVPGAEGWRRMGVGWSIGDELTVVRAVHLFESAGKTPETLSEAYPGFDLEERYLAGIDDYPVHRVRREGRVFVVDAAIRTRRFDYFRAGDPTQPEVTFSFEYDTGELAVRHDGGDAVPSSKLSLRYGPSTDDLTLTFDRTFRSEYPHQRIAEGDSLTVSVDGARGKVAGVVWQPFGMGNDLQVLRSTDIPE